MSSLKLFSPDSGPPEPSAGPTVAEVVRDYLAYAQHFLDPRTYELRARYLSAFAAEYGPQPVAGCRRSDLELWLAAHPEWASDWTVRGICNAVQRCFNWAVGDDRIPRNPFHGVTRREGEPRRPLTEAEFAAMLRLSDPLFRRVLMFMRLTGCRPCEMSVLRWDQLELETDLFGSLPVIVLRKHKTSKQQRQPRPRVIRLVPVAVQLLLWLRRRRHPDDPSQVIFRNRRGNPWNRSNLSLRMQRLRARAKLAMSAKLYGIRHQFGTQGAVNGVPLKTLAELMGHTSSRTTEKYYVHLEAEQQHMADAMAQAVQRPKK